MKLSKVYKAKNYDEAVKKCPKGYRMLEIWELVKLACEGEKKIFETEKDRWLAFWSKTLYGDYGARRLSRNRYGYWGAYWGNLSNTEAGGRVIYVKEDLKNDLGI